MHFLFCHSYLVLLFLSLAMHALPFLSLLPCRMDTLADATSTSLLHVGKKEAGSQLHSSAALRWWDKFIVRLFCNCVWTACLTSIPLPVNLSTSICDLRYTSMASAYWNVYWVASKFCKQWWKVLKAVKRNYSLCQMRSWWEGNLLFVWVWDLVLLPVKNGETESQGRAWV